MIREEDSGGDERVALIYVQKLGRRAEATRPAGTLETPRESGQPGSSAMMAMEVET